MSKVRKSKILSIVVIIAIISTLVSSIGSFTASADVVYYTDGENYNFAVSNGEATIIEYIGSGGDITIPSTIYGYPVTAIGNRAFEECTSLTSVSMPSVTTIGSHAFYYCENLVEVDVPKVTTIGDYAFMGCKSLTSVDMPSVTTIERSAFYVCSSLVSVSIPKVTSIGDDAFSFCADGLTIYAESDSYAHEYAVNNGIKFMPTNSIIDGDYIYIVTDDEAIIVGYNGEGGNITIPSTLGGYPVTTIGNDAFRNNTTLSSVSMPSVITVGERAFYNCYLMNNINMPNVTNIGEMAFCYCGFGSVSAPKVVTVGEYAFGDCRYLMGIDIAGAITIGEYAFYNCQSLISIDMSNVKTIGEWAFGFCIFLEGVYIPSVTTIGKYAFSGSGIEAFSVSDDNQYYSTQDGVLFNKDKTEIVVYPAGKTSSSYTVPDSVTTIGDTAFCRNSRLESIYMQNVTTIGDEAFSYNYNLTNLDMPNVITIGEITFLGCEALDSVTIPKAVSIGDGAFSFCASLERISMPVVTSIGEDAFAYCSDELTIYAETGSYAHQYAVSNGIKFMLIGALIEGDYIYTVSDGEATIKEYIGEGGDVTIPSTLGGYPVITIGEEAFRDCDTLTSVSMPSVTTIGESAFGFCPNLYSVDMPEVTTIGDGAFEYCSNLNSAKMPNVITVGNRAFEFCSSLLKAEMPNATTIGESAFEECSHLYRADMPKATTIGNSAFRYCIRLLQVTMLNVTVIGDSAFYKSNLYSVQMPKATTIGDEAFYGCDLSSVNISASVSSIGVNSFAYCSFLKTITVDSENKYYSAQNDVLFNKDKTELICYPAAKTDSSYVVPDSVRTISNYAFCDCDSLTSVNTSSVINVWDSAFSDCGSLVSISMPNVQELGQNIFEYCSELTTVSMENIISVGDSSFYACRSLKSVSIPNATTLEFGAFDSCTSLTDIYMPKVTTVGRWAFNNCPSLKNIDMPSSTNIGGLAFGSCTSLTSVNMPNATTIGIRAFAGSGIKNIDLSNVTSIGKNAFDGCENVTIYAPANSYAHQYALDNGINFMALAVEKIKDVNYEIAGDKIVFTVITGAGDYNRIKVTTADKLSGSLGVASSYTVNSDGDYVWTIKAVAPTETTNYAFDIRSSETGRYLKDYYYCEVEVIQTVKSVSHEVVDGKVIFTVVTCAGDYSRIKVTTADNLGGSLGVASTYTVNAEGNYVWTVKATEPTETTNYAFDLRNGTTSKYLKEYFYYEAEASAPKIISASHEIADGKIVFTVVTKPGDFGRIKVTTADNLGGSLGVASTYAVNAQGNYVWTVKATEPTETTNYAFDLRNGTTSKYLKEYFYYEAEASTPKIISASHKIADGKVIFTVVTKSGDFGRIKVTTADNLGGSLGVASTYTVNAQGNYVWTVKATEPTETTNYAFDLRNGTTSKYLKEYYYYEVEADTTPTFLSASHEISGDKIIFTVVTTAGDYNRVKVAFADDLKGYIAYTNNHTVDSDGNYVWTIKADAPTEATEYAFDVRSSETGKYVKEYYCLTVTANDEYSSARKEGVINSPVTKTISMYKVNADTFEVGEKQNRTITFKGTIKIGNTAASTGVFASVGLPFNTGLEAYINEINFNGGAGGDYASGKQGYYIEFINYDDGFQADVGSSYTKKLVEEDKVFALVGHFGSPTVGATINYIKETGVIACYFASGVGTLFNADATSTEYGSTLFPVQPIYTTEGRIMVGRIIQQYPDAKKIGVVYTNDEAGVGISDGAQAQIEALGFGYECVLSEVSTDATDFTPAVAKVKDCDVIIVAGIQKGTVSIIKSMIANRIYKPVFTSYSVASVVTLMEVKPFYDELEDANKFPIYANAWLSSSDLESFIEFNTDILSYTGENTLTVNSYAMEGWIAANTFCEGLERIVKSGKEINNLTFVEAMESSKVEVKMTSGATVDYSDGCRFGTTTMALLKNNATCNSFVEADDMKDFYNFIKTGNTSSL